MLRKDNAYNQSTEDIDQKRSDEIYHRFDVGESSRSELQRVRAAPGKRRVRHAALRQVPEEIGPVVRGDGRLDDGPRPAAARRVFDGPNVAHSGARLQGLHRGGREPGRDRRLRHEIRNPLAAAPRQPAQRDDYVAAAEPAAGTRQRNPG